MRKLAALFLLSVASLAPEAYAQQKSSGDLFADQGFYVDERPLGMNAPRFHHSDVFGPPNMYMSSSKDMFDHTNHANDYGNTDMFGGSRKHMDEPYTPLFKGVPNKE